MKIPGFTAEVSLYETSRQYCDVLNALAQANSGVIASTTTCTKCHLDDMGNCVKDCTTCLNKIPPICTTDTYDCNSDQCLPTPPPCCPPGCTICP